MRFEAGTALAVGLNDAPERVELVLRMQRIKGSEARSDFSVASSIENESSLLESRCAMRFVSIDFETANERRESACAIGVAVVEDGKVVSRLHRLIRPIEMRFSSMNVAIHGITAGDVESAPTFSHVWEEIALCIGQSLVVAHNAAFDMSVLRYTLHANGIPFPEISYLCSLKLASRVWPTLVCHRLAFLAEHHGIELDHHNAESDAAAAAEIVLKAGQEHSIQCALHLAKQFDVSIGTISSDGSWRPSSAARICGTKKIELAIPEDFDVAGHPLHGKVLVFTGTLTSMERGNAEELVSSVLGIARSNVTKKTDYLVCGAQELQALAQSDYGSAKLKNAKALRDGGSKIQILGEDDFLKLLTGTIID